MRPLDIDASPDEVRAYRKALRAFERSHGVRPDPYASAYQKTRALFERFTAQPFDTVPDAWRTFTASVIPDKAEADYTAKDWRALCNVMRKVLKQYPTDYPHGVTIDPAPFCVWFAAANGMPAE